MNRPPSREEPTLVAVSGGVDSAVAALLLVRAGVDVEAVFMKNWDEDDDPAHCPAAIDLADAERVCERLGIGLRTVSFATEYWDRVFERFLEEHRAGRTPNPDVWCNREIKFGELVDFAEDRGRPTLATGHYARSMVADDGVRLLRGRDPEKDQSYFLYRIDQAALARARFPVGDLAKSEVRRIAREAELLNHAKPSSTGICFIGERPFRAFLSRYLAEEPGPIETSCGRILGEHRGLAFYTLGQRQGLGVGGVRECGGAPWYVAAKEAERNALIVVCGREHPRLRARHLDATEVSWVAGQPPALPLRCSARARYRQPDRPCRVERLGSGGVRVEFAEPQWALAPGQSVVFYDGEVCLGGGIIERVSARA